MENFARKSDGNLVFVALSRVGANNVVDFSKMFEASARQFTTGRGWPKNPPVGLGLPLILTALHR